MTVPLRSPGVRDTTRRAFQLPRRVLLFGGRVGASESVYVAMG